MGAAEPEYHSSVLVRISPDALVQVTGDEAVVLDAAGEQFFGLNAVAARLWVLLADDPVLAHAYSRLLDEYEVEPAQLQRDLHAIVSELAQAGLVRIDGP